MVVGTPETLAGSFYQPYGKVPQASAEASFARGGGGLSSASSVVLKGWLKDWEFLSLVASGMVR